ncbi:MAG: type II secretion system protein [Myxococcota bacterium]
MLKPVSSAFRSPETVHRTGSVARSSRGFTLIELGIVIGVIAILTAVVVTARGFVDQSRIGNAVQAVSAVRDASRGFAKRQTGGASFEGLTDISLLVGANNFFATAPVDPWSNVNLDVAATGADFGFIDVSICIGSGTTAVPVGQDFTRAASSLGTITTGAACGNGGFVHVVQTR